MHPVVDRRIAGTRVERQHRSSLIYVTWATPPMFTTTTGSASPDLRASSRMIKRHQGRALAARLHVGAAEIIDHIDAGQPRQQRTVTDLPGPVPLGPMQDGLAVKPRSARPVRRPDLPSATAPSRPRHGPRSAAVRPRGWNEAPALLAATRTGLLQAARSRARVSGVIGHGQRRPRAAPRPRRRSPAWRHPRHPARCRSSGR